MRIEVNSAAEHAALVARMAAAPFKKPYIVEVITGPGRSNDQNRLLWQMLRDVSQAVEWPPGSGRYLVPDDWKTLFTASLGGQKAMPGLDGSVVFVGARTSKMNVSEMTELLDFIRAEGHALGVTFTDEEPIE